LKSLWHKLTDSHEIPVANETSSNTDPSSKDKKEMKTDEKTSKDEEKKSP
jgi:hypothetical protein